MGKIIQSRLENGPLPMTLVLPTTVTEAREAAPQFAVTFLWRRQLQQRLAEGKAALVQFWTNWCPICRSDQPALNRIVREYSSRGLIVFAVDVNEPSEAATEYLKEHPRANSRRRKDMPPSKCLQPNREVLAPPAPSRL
jgi:thiol-disulfide isomerase/thioredoxin